MTLGRSFPVSGHAKHPQLEKAMVASALHDVLCLAFESHADPLGECGGESSYLSPKGEPSTPFPTLSWDPANLGQ